MSYFRTCPICGANLDPSELCECIKNTAHGAGTSESGKHGKAITHLNYITKGAGSQCLEVRPAF